MPSDAEILALAKKPCKGGKALEQATDVQRDNDEIVRAAVESAGYALEHASERLRDDETIVRAAVKQYGYALEFASDRLRDDEVTVHAATRWTGAFEFVSERLRDDETFMREAIFTGPQLKYASERLRDDEAFMREHIKEYPVTYPAGLPEFTLRYASERLRDDEEFVSAAVREHYGSIKYASPRLQTEPSFVLAFVEQLVLENDAVNECDPLMFLNLLKKSAKALAEARSQLNREVIDVDSGETTYEPAPKRARTERAADEPPPRSGLALAAEATTSAKEIKTELTTQRDAERRRADDLAERNECCVCMEADAAVCFLPCRHLSTCEACAAPLESCPTCRVPIQRRIVVFRN